MALADSFQVLFAQRRLIIGLTIVVVAIAAAVAWMLPTIYAANVKILVPRAAPGVFVDLLKSDEMAYAMVDRFGLAAHYGEKNRSDASRVFTGQLKASSGKDGTVQIRMEDVDPQFAANLTQGLVEQLRAFASKRLLTDSALNRRTLMLQRGNAERRVEALERNNVEKAIPRESRFIIRVLADLRAELALVSGDPTKDRQDVVRMQEYVGRLESWLQQAKSLSDLSLTMEQQQQYQELAYFQALIPKLERRIEIAAAEEEVEVRLISAVIPPDQKSGPKRGLIVAVSAVVAFLLACGLALVVDRFRRRVVAVNNGGDAQPEVIGG